MLKCLTVVGWLKRLVNEFDGIYINMDEVSFPVLCKYKNMIFASRSLDALTDTTSSAVKGGLFDQMVVVDSSGTQHTVVKAKVIGGIGLFFGFNIFLNRRIRVNLEFRRDFRKWTLEDVKDVVLSDLQSFHGWQSRLDFYDLKNQIRSASSIKDVLDLISLP